jgi:hypothetical protein
MSKKYGKLTPAQFKGLIDAMPEVRRQGEDVSTALASDIKEQLDELLVPGYYWGAIHEYPFHEHLAAVAWALGIAPYVRRLAQQPDSQQCLIEDLQKLDAAADKGLKVEKEHVFGLAYSLQRTLQSIML